MRVAQLSLIVLAVFTLTSCIGTVQYTERLILKPELRNFGLAGEWQWTPQSADVDPNEVGSVTIDGPDGSGTYRVHLTGQANTKITVVATHLNNQTNHAIVELEIQEGELRVGRTLAYALADNDQLTVWWLAEDHLAEIFKREKRFAVIEKGLTGTRVSAEPADMLRVLRSHSKTLAGRTDVFRRIASSPK